MQDRPESEARLLSELLALMILVSGRRRRSLEEELGLGDSGLDKILNGTTPLRMSDLLSLLAAIRLDPYDFLNAIYPGGRVRESPLAEEIRAFLEEKEPPKAPVKRTRSALLEHVRSLLDKGDDELPDSDERLRRLQGDEPQTTN